MSYFLLNLNVPSTYIANTATYIVTANELYHNTSMQIGGTTSSQYLSNYVVNDPTEKILVFGKNGVQVNSHRDVMTNGPLDISNTAVLEFYVSKGGGTWGDPPDNGEDLFLQYSTDSANWNTITSISASDTSSDKWIHITTKIPEAAKTQPVWLRYYMVQVQGSAQLNDQWAVSSLTGYPSQSSNSLNLDASANTEILYNNKGIVDGSNAVYINTTNRFGFGNTAPVGFFHVEGNSYFFATMNLNNQNIVGVNQLEINDPGEGIVFRNLDSRTVNWEIIDGAGVGGYQFVGQVGGNLHFTKSRTSNSALVLLSNNAVFVANSLIISNNGGNLQANGSFGLPGQVLTSNGQGVFWSSATGGAGAIGYTGSLGFTGSAGLGYTGSKGDPGPPSGYTGSAGAVGKPARSQKIISTGATTYTMQEFAPSPENIFVILNGLVLLPTTDYGVNGFNLILANAPPVNSDIEIRFFDVVAPTGYQGSLGFIGSQGITGFTGSAGLGGGNGFGGSIGFTGSPGVGFTGSFGLSGYTGSKGDPSGYTGSAGAGRPVAVQTFVSTGTASYTLNYSVTHPLQVMVIVNGLVQIPFTDYSVQNTNLTLNTTPPTGSDIEVLYFNSDPLVGFQGSLGFRGSIGYTGSIGAGGTDGYSGSRGYTGSIGYSGSRGDSGYSGSTGAVGAPDYSQKIVSTGTSSYSLDRQVSSPNHIIVSVNGLVQMPTTDYAILALSTISFVNPPATGSDIEIRYFALATQVGYQGSKGADGSAGPGYTGSLGFQGSSGQGGFSAIYIGPTSDPSPFDGELWFDTDNGILSIFYQSANTWVGIGPGLRGAAGYTGSAGPAGGYTGSQGNIGSTGSIGFTGSQGSGFQGSTGFTGSIGFGYTGSKGDPVGYTGSIGAGYQGSLGYTGSIGAGYTGSQGIIGYTGSAGGGSGTGLSPRGYNQGLSTGLASGATANFYLTAGKTYALLKIYVSHPAWVRIYDTVASRTADATRPLGQEPSYNSGVIAEVVTTSTNETIKLTPGVLGMNNESPVVDKAYIAATNLGTGPVNLNVGITYVSLEG